MLESRFGFRTADTPSLTSSSGLKNGYSKWKRYKSNKNVGVFFVLYNDLKEMLCDISGGALKLYIFYCFASKNKTGESWHAVSTIADELCVSTRSIDKWNAELEELGLIKRKIAGKPTKTVFLIPLSDYVYHVGSFEQLNSWIKEEEFPDVYGNVKKSLILVQIKKTKKSIKTEIYHVLVVEKSHGKVNTVCTVFSYKGKSPNLVPEIEVEDRVDEFYLLKKHPDISSFETGLEPDIWLVSNEYDCADDKTLIDLAVDLTRLKILKESYSIIDWRKTAEGSDADE